MDITELLGPNNLKKLRFIELLNANSTEWISKEKLALELNVSIKRLFMLYESVDLSDSKLMSKIKLEVNNNLGFRITVSISSILDEIRLELLKSEICFNLIIDSFNNNYGSRTIFLERMFISRATLYREISKLKVFLIKFDLSFNSKNGKIIGKRNKIRKFYFHFFWETYKMFDWPFKKIYLKEIENAIECFQKNSNIELDIVTKHRFKYLLAVVFNDIYQELFIDEQVSIEIKKDLVFNAINLIFQRKYYLLSKNKIKKEVFYVYQFFLSSLASNEKERTINLAMDYFKLNNPKEYGFSTELLKSIELEFPDIFKSTKEKERVLFSGMQLIVELKKFGDVYVYKYNDEISVHHHEFQIQLKKIIVRLIEKFDLFYIHLDKLDSLVMMITNYFYFNTDLRNTMSEYTIMIISDNNNIVYYIQSKLNELVPIKLKIVDNMQMDKNIDLIITDIKSGISYQNIPVFNILDVFNTNDWVKLIEIILKRNAKKKGKGSVYYAD